MASAGKADAAATTCSSADSSCVLKVEAATATISNGAAGQSLLRLTQAAVCNGNRNSGATLP